MFGIRSRVVDLVAKLAEEPVQLVEADVYVADDVERARHNSYRVKRPGDHGTGHNGPATIKLVNLQPPPRAA